MTDTKEALKARVFWVAEELSGKLHIFRENHEGGGLTKFVEYSAIHALQQELEAVKSLMSVQLDMHEQIKELEQENERLKKALMAEKHELVGFKERWSNDGVIIDELKRSRQYLESQLTIAEKKLEKAVSQRNDAIENPVPYPFTNVVIQRFDSELASIKGSGV